jgi:hypothetical protein
MQTINTRLFEGKECPLIIYNGQAIIDQVFKFYTIDLCDEDETKIPFDFPDYESSYFRVYNEREGRLIVDITTMSRNNDSLILNASASDMEFDDLGNYYYEIGYVRGVYEQALRFGTASVI